MVFPQRFFSETLKLGEDGGTGQENDLLEEAFERTGASIMGMNMFLGGDEGWPEEAPFHTPVYVPTHEDREPWQRPGGTVFHFVTDGIHAALDQAREASGDRDVRIAGGVETDRQYLNAGLVDELTLHIFPDLVGRGLPLFDGVDRSRFSLKIVGALHAPDVAYVTVQGRQPARGGRGVTRAIVISQLVDAPEERVFEAFTDPDMLGRWWGPDGFTITTKRFDFRQGGVWEFFMHGPDGTDLPNQIEFRWVVPLERIVYDHGSSSVHPGGFRNTFMMEWRGDATLVTMHTVFPTVEEHEAAVDAGFIEGGEQTLARLAMQEGEGAIRR